jgi:hypothetical protein
MPGKDKTVKAGKGKKALADEWAEAVAAADNGERLTTSASNIPKGGRPISSNYIPPKPKPPRTVDDDDMPKGKGGKKK